MRYMEQMFGWIKQTVGEIRTNQKFKLWLKLPRILFKLSTYGGRWVERTAIRRK